MIKSYKTLLMLALVTNISLSALVEPTFHLKNNSKDAIQIDIKQNGASVFKIKPAGLRPIAKNGEFPFQLDISKPSVLEIQTCDQSSGCLESLHDTFIVDFKENKKIYVKFDGKKIEPQKGNLRTGTTTKGYSLANTATKNDMKTRAITAQDRIEMAWKTFPEANKLRKNSGAKLHENPELALKVLDLQKGASSAEIKKAYIKLSRIYHPDKYAGEDKAVGTEIFKIINEAQQVLLSE